MTRPVPVQPRDLGSTSDSITIQWTRPRNDGGSPITGYVIEKRKVGGGGWSKACHAVVSDVNYKVTGLEENCEYEFKVAAVNAAGQGPWSPPSGLTTDSFFSVYLWYKNIIDLQEWVNQ